MAELWSTPSPGLEVGTTAAQILTLPEQVQWYALYTRFRYEKQVAAMLTYREVEYYLPLYEAMHRWKDRNARVQLPLFPSYIFVRLDLQDRMRALTIPGVIRLVGSKHPEPLSSEEVEAIKSYLSCRLPVEPYPYLTQGTRVRIVCGPLAGMEGLILRRKSTCRIVINLDLIQRSMLVEVAAADVEYLGAAVPHLAAA
ncbi:MAG TPA: UpxY family transcription antiterminator [Terriglobales bacterium]|nr:UpxY family transcription antiterminator [Terriglobales bacterium]